MRTQTPPISTPLDINENKNIQENKKYTHIVLYRKKLRKLRAKNRTLRFFFCMFVEKKIQMSSVSIDIIYLQKENRVISSVM